MPKRTKKERALIDSLPKKPADTLCNGRTPTGYCKNRAGWKTDHPGTGRCKYHGGSSKGRPIVHGLYSKSLTSTIQKEYEKIVNDPALIDLYGELALMKALLSNLLSNIEGKLSDEERNWWIQTTETKFGAIDSVSAEATALMKVVEQLTKVYDKILTAEKKSQEQLTVRDIYVFIQNMKISLKDTCGTCPVRKTLGNKLTDMKFKKLDEGEDEIEEAKIKHLLPLTERK